MSEEAMTAATALVETLEAENAALAALDLPRAAGLLADKQRAVAEFAAAAPQPAAQRTARRLRALAIENKRLLERALAVQGKVIGIVARAAAASEQTRYGQVRKERAMACRLWARV
jgi:hypothetical protein